MSRDIEYDRYMKYYARKMQELSRLYGKETMYLMMEEEMHRLQRKSPEYMALGDLLDASL